jgi:hypothetical protein
MQVQVWSIIMIDLSLHLYGYLIKFNVYFTFPKLNI